MSGIVAVTILVAAIPARHTELDTASPEPEAVVREPVRDILLTFTTSVNADLSRITVSDADGGTLGSGPVEHPPGREDQIRVLLDTPLPSGAYRVDWRTLAPDGHVVEGTFTFAVDLPGQEEAPDASAPASDSADAPELPESTGGPAEGTTSVGTDGGSVRSTGGAWIRWMQLLGVVLLLGGIGWRFAVLPTTGLKVAEPEIRARILRGLSRFAWLATALLLASLPLRLIDQLSALGDGTGLSGALVLLFETAWGAGWFLHLGAVTLTVFGLALTSPRGRRDRGWVVVALAALILPLALALQGHAWGEEGNRALAVGSLYLHVLGASLWMGGLVLLVLVGLPALKQAKTPEDEMEEGRDEASFDEDAESPPARPALSRLVNAFSRVALPAVGLVLASGVVNAWFTVGGIDALVGSAYGRTLLLKLAFVAGAMLLGFYNWRRVRPTLVRDPQVGALRIPATIEAAIGVVILFVTAVLVATPPP